MYPDKLIAKNKFLLWRNSPMEYEIKITIASVSDIIIAREKGRHIGNNLGFNITDLTIITTVISEVARNIILFAKEGEIILSTVQQDNQKGIEIVAKDQGPGIHDIPRAMQDGYSTRKGLGLGLPSVKRLMDAFEINSKVGNGTTIVMKKWLNGIENIHK